MVTSTYGIKIVTINAIGWRESHFEHKSGAGPEFNKKVGGGGGRGLIP